MQPLYISRCNELIACKNGRIKGKTVLGELKKDSGFVVELQRVLNIDDLEDEVHILKEKENDSFGNN